MKTLKQSLCTIAVIMISAAAFSACERLNGKLSVTPPSDAAYSISLPATLADYTPTKGVSFGDGSSVERKFEASDEVFVFLERTGQFIGISFDGKGEFTALKPTDINGNSATLKGNITFYAEQNDGSYSPVAPAVGDVLHLYYNVSAPDIQFDLTKFLFDLADGSAERASRNDFAIAFMKISAINGDISSGFSLSLVQVNDGSKTTANFESLGSMFHKKLFFWSLRGALIAPAVKELSVTSLNGSSVLCYSPIPFSQYVQEPYIIKNNNCVYDTNGNLYFSMMFKDSPDGDVLVLHAEDAEENHYMGYVKAPDGGFANGKLYSGDLNMNWKWKITKPTLLGTQAEPDETGTYNIDETFIRIQNLCYGYSFNMKSREDLMVWLEFLMAGHTGTGGAFLRAPVGNLGIYLNDVVVLDCENAPYAIYAAGNLAFDCAGDPSATLTVTSGDARYCGLYSANYTPETNMHDNTDSVDVSSMLAAPDYYSVTRSARTDNVDGTFTWTYTVKHL